MTREEAEHLQRLTEAIVSMQTELAALRERIDAVCELRTANGTLTKSYIERLEERCDERHGGLINRVEKLEHQERASFGWRERATGAASLVAVLVSIVAVVVRFIS